MIGSMRKNKYVIVAAASTPLPHPIIIVTCHGYINSWKTKYLRGLCLKIQAIQLRLRLHGVLTPIHGAPFRRDVMDKSIH
jgi:hypothetical protein